MELDEAVVIIGGLPADAQGGFIPREVRVRPASPYLRFTALLILPWIMLLALAPAVLEMNVMLFLIFLYCLGIIGFLYRFGRGGFFVTDKYVVTTKNYWVQLVIPKGSVRTMLVAGRPSRIQLELCDGSSSVFIFGRNHGDEEAGRLEVKKVAEVMRQAFAGSATLVIRDPEGKPTSSGAGEIQNAGVKKRWVWPTRTEWLLHSLYTVLFFGSSVLG